MFATPSATQKELYSTKSKKQRAKGAQNTINSSPLSPTASQSPESSNRARPGLPCSPREVVSQMVYDIPVEKNGGFCSSDLVALGRAAKQEERRQTSRVEGQTENDGSILFEDGSGSDAENAVESVVTSPEQRRAAKMARLKEEQTQRIIDENLKLIEMRSSSTENVSGDVDKEKAFAEMIVVVAAMKKMTDNISRTLKSEKRYQKLMIDEYETTKKKADEQARNVEALLEAKKETEEAKRRDVEAEQKAKKQTDEAKGWNVQAKQNAGKEPRPQKPEMLLEKPPPVSNPFYYKHAQGFVSLGRGRGKSLVAHDTEVQQYNFPNLRTSISLEEEAEAALWQECKLIRLSRREGDAPPPVPETKDRSLKRILSQVNKGFRLINDSALRLAAATWCSRRVRLTCEDINHAVDMWKMELMRVGHQYRLAYRFNQDLIRCSQLSGTEQALSRRALNRDIRLYYMKEPFRKYTMLSREIYVSFQLLARFTSRWGGGLSRSRVEAWRKHFNHGNMERSINDYLETVFTRVDACFDTKPWEKCFWKFAESMHHTGSAMSRIFCFWKENGLLIFRLRILDLRREMRDDEVKMRESLQECFLIVSRRTQHSMIAPDDPVHVSDYEQKDAEEVDVGLSAQISSKSGTLNISPTSKLGSSCSAMGSPSSDIDALVDMVDYTSMVYQIPEEVMREAMLASSSTGAAYWQYSLYQEGGDPSGDKVKVHYCTSKETTERIAQLFLNQEVIGFDIEWKPQAQVGEGIKKNVSLIQLASEERIALFHVARYGKGETIDDLLAPSLKKIMESPEISKVGVSVKADCTRLRRFLGIEARGLFELSHLYKLIKHSAGDVKKINKLLVSLAQQVEEHLQLPMWKGEVRSSDWSQKLNYEQIKCRQTSLLSREVTYSLPDAASDSYAGLRLYDVMESKRKTLEPTPPRPAHAELNLPIILANGKTVATYDEPDEPKDEKPIEDVSAHPADLEEMARDFLDIELEDSKINPSTTSKSAARGSKKSPEITVAEAWVTDWRSKLPSGYKSRAMPSQLRAYALWSELGKEVPEVAQILRDPPLQVTTVANYILEAVRLEKLPFQEPRLEKVWELLPARAPGRGRRPQGGK